MTLAMDPVTLLFGVGIALVLAGGFRALWGLYLSTPARPVPAGDASNDWETGRAAVPAAARDRPREILSLETADEEGASTVRTATPIDDVLGPPTSAELASVDRIGPEAVERARRILIHLAGIGALDPGRPAPDAATVTGISSAVGAVPGRVEELLARLDAGGAVRSEWDERTGGSRGRRVYAITPLGRRLLGTAAAA